MFAPLKAISDIRSKIVSSTQYLKVSSVPLSYSKDYASLLKPSQLLNRKLTHSLELKRIVADHHLETYPSFLN